MSLSSRLAVFFAAVLLFVARPADAAPWPLSCVEPAVSSLGTCAKMVVPGSGATAGETLLEKADSAFGACLVAPLGSVMFCDVVFWDDLMPAGEGIGTVVDGEEITSWNEADGYSYQKLFDAQRVLPDLSSPVRKDFGGVPVEIKVGDVNGTPTLVGRVLPEAADLEKLGIERPVDDVDLSDAPPIDVKTAPFAVKVDPGTGKFIEQTVVLPDDALEVETGASVMVPGVAAAAVVVGKGDGGWKLRSGEVRLDKSRLPSADNAVMPIVVLWLVMGAIFFTFRMVFVNLRAFKHAILVTAGRFDDPDDTGEISHFQALSSALSATVGLGNIAGVAIAITVGGPGAVFWMIMAGFLGMSSKFTECTLGQMYRVTKPDGSVSGGPMHYLDKGLAEMGLAPLGKGLALLFAVMCIGGSLGGGNMFQANQSYNAVAEILPVIDNSTGAVVYGLVLAFLVGLVIIGGIKRIGAIAGLIVPAMCGIYVAAGMLILVMHASEVPAAIGAIVSSAFSPEAGLGGMIGVLAQGFKRASFSNEAGIGSASIAHSAAKTEWPVREGIVALLEPFIDTIIVCSTTALVVVVTGVYQIEGEGGVVLTQRAFESSLTGFSYVLSVAVFLFAFSTMISWSYYGERCATWLFGDSVSMPYRILFLFCVVFGSVVSLGNVVDFSDMMVLGMGFPNILGAVLLSGKVKRALDDYLKRLRNGEFKQHA